MVLDLGGSRPERRGRTTSQGRPRTGLLYEQVVEYVEKLVSDRGLAPGDLLPTYAELAERVGVSLITVRRALDELERAGRVRRHQGLGTFLARPRIVTEPTRAGSLLGTLAKSEEVRPAEQLVSRSGGSLYDLLAREFGLQDEYEEQYLEVIVPTPQERRLLSIPARTQV